MPSNPVRAREVELTPVYQTHQNTLKQCETELKVHQAAVYVLATVSAIFAAAAVGAIVAWVAVPLTALVGYGLFFVAAVATLVALAALFYKMWGGNLEDDPIFKMQNALVALLGEELGKVSENKLALLEKFGQYYTELDFNSLDCELLKKHNVHNFEYGIDAKTYLNWVVNNHKLNKTLPDTADKVAAVMLKALNNESPLIDFDTLDVHLPRTFNDYDRRQRRYHSLQKELQSTQIDDGQSERTPAQIQEDIDAQIKKIEETKAEILKKIRQPVDSFKEPMTFWSITDIKAVLACLPNLKKIERGQSASLSAAVEDCLKGKKDIKFGRHALHEDYERKRNLYPGLNFFAASA